MQPIQDEVVVTISLPRIYAQAIEDLANQITLDLLEQTHKTPKVFSLVGITFEPDQSVVRSFAAVAGCGCVHCIGATMGLIRSVTAEEVAAAAGEVCKTGNPMDAILAAGLYNRLGGQPDRKREEERQALKRRAAAYRKTTSPEMGGGGRVISRLILQV